MKRIHRLSSTREFQRVLKVGKRGSSGAVVCFAAAAPHPSPPGRKTQAADISGAHGSSDGLPPARVGVTAGRKVGSAVRRNRAKRLLREAASAQLPLIPAGTDIVLIARPSILGKDSQTVREDVARAMRAAGIAC